MHAVTALPGMRGVDTVKILTADDCRAIKAACFDFVSRYTESVTQAELKNIFDAGLLWSPVSYSRKPGWLPNGDIGSADGAAAVSRARILGVPASVTLWCDFETPGEASSIDDRLAYGRMEAGVVFDAGFTAGIYGGYGMGFTSEELYSLPYTRYWHSCSKVRDRFNKPVEPDCGWCKVQVHPPELSRAGIDVDINFTQMDYFGRAVILAAG